MTLPANKELNLKTIDEKLAESGLSLSDLANRLGVSKQIVSQWFQKKKFPRPAKLLALGRVLNLAFKDLVIRIETSDEPVIAFRKKKGYKIEDIYVQEAKERGNLLEGLVPHLPFDNLSCPPALAEPLLSYDYVQQVAEETRKHIAEDGSEEIKFESLINFFDTYHATLIPVFWGEKKHHENALHIYLPRARATWIYLNLDSHIHDFKFWMAHELGHVKAPNLKGDLGEDFADAFAGALLFSCKKAESEYRVLSSLGTKAKQINRIKEVANQLIVSPITIYLEINKYAAATKKPAIDLDSDREIYKACSVFNKQFKTVAETLFEDKKPSAKDYVVMSQERFKSNFFIALKKHLKETHKSPSFIQNLLNIPLVDAKEIYAEIV